MKVTIIVAYTLGVTWLQKTRAQRREFQLEHVAPIFEKYAHALNIRIYDAESFAIEFSDFIIIETESLEQYYYMFEELRDSRLVTDGYVTFKRIFIGIEDGYRKFEQDVHGVM